MLVLEKDILNSYLVGSFSLEEGLKFKLLKNFTVMFWHFLSAVIVMANEWSREQVED